MTDDRAERGSPAQPALIVACPTCRKSIPFSTDNPDRPFCSERCRLIDLGAWAEGRHHIPGDTQWSDSGDDPGDEN